jgi:leucyl-tRNA synthetase
MPNWAGSNWYFIRYSDPKNNKQLVDPKKAKYWLPVDWYNGGMEHTTLHLLYSRFVFKFLYDIGAVPKEVGSEPYKKRTAQGMILGEGGIKMSKSKGNVVNPDIYVSQYGADTVRVYEMFMGPFDQAIAWDDKGVNGVYRFLNRVYDLVDKVDNKSKDSVDVLRVLNQSIEKVSEDIETMRFNTAISQLMILTNALDKENKISLKTLEDFVLILSPFAPHIAEELWEKLGHKKSLASEKWPEYDKTLIKEESVSIGIQVNGKLRDEIKLPYDTEASKKIEEQVLAMEKVKKHIEGKEVVKFIHIKNKIISIVVK